MSDLDRYYPQPPLTGSARVIRGFRRAGIVFAALILMVGMGVSLTIGIETYTSKSARFSQANCLMSKAKSGASLPTLSYDKSKIDPQAAGCEGPIYSTYPWEIPGYLVKPSFFDDFAPTGVFGSLAAIVAAAVVFGLFWAVGWVVAGFLRD